MQTDQEVIEIYKNALRELANEFNYVKQLRPLIPHEDEGYSKPISFEDMSKYAIAYMELMNIEHCGTQWERV